jgi:hypothetical protein
MKNDDIFYDCLTKDGSGGGDHRKISPKQKQLINKNKNKQSRKSKNKNNGKNCTKNVVVSNKNKYCSYIACLPY